MKHKILFTFKLTTALLPAALRTGETNQWTFDALLYGLAAGMAESGDPGKLPLVAIPAQ